MRQVSTLLRLDFLRIRNWFRTYTGTKLIVIGGFAVVIAFVVAVEYFLSRSFFMIIASQEEFGLAVSRYSMNAAMLLLFLFSLASTMAAGATIFFRPDYLRHLL